MIRVTADNMCV